MSFERLLKTLHSWLGVLILPWIVMAGLTGLYMNHSRLILSWLPATGIEVSALDSLPGGVPQTKESAWAIARAAAPDAALKADPDDSYRGRRVFAFDGDGTDVQVDQATGYHWVVRRYSVVLRAPDGQRVDTEIRWSRVLSSLHERGWIGSALGSWLADITAGALAVFGLSGLYLFTAPRLRRMKNRRARKAMADPRRMA